MRLTNFELASTVELSGVGRSWDLHNCVDFSGLELVPEEGAARMRWVVSSDPELSRLGFALNNPARSCAIRFDGVAAVTVRRVRDGSAPSDARTLHQARLVAPIEETQADAARLRGRVPSEKEGAHLLFEFMDGFDVEVAADSATLEPNG